MSQSSTFLSLTFRHAVVADFYNRFHIDSKERLRVLKWLILIGIKETKKAIHEQSDSEGDSDVPPINAAFVENLYHTKSMTPVPPSSDDTRSKKTETHNDKLTCELHGLRDELLKVSEQVTRLRKEKTVTIEQPKNDTTEEHSQNKSTKIISHSKTVVKVPKIEGFSDDVKTVGGDSTDQWQLTYPQWWPRDDDESGEYVSRRRKQSHRVPEKVNVNQFTVDGPNSPHDQRPVIVVDRYPNVRQPSEQPTEKLPSMTIPAHLVTAKEQAELYGFLGSSSDLIPNELPSSKLPEMTGFKASLLKEAQVQHAPSPPAKPAENRKPIAFSVDMSGGPSIDMASVLKPIADHTRLLKSPDQDHTTEIDLTVSKKKSALMNDRRKQSKRGRRDGSQSMMPRHVFVSTVSTDSKRQRKKKSQVASKLRAQIRRDRSAFMKRKKQREKGSKIRDESKVEIVDHTMGSLGAQRLLAQTTAERRENHTVLKDAFERMNFGSTSQSSSVDISHIDEGGSINAALKNKDKRMVKSEKKDSVKLKERDQSTSEVSSSLGLNQRISEIMVSQKQRKNNMSGVDGTSLKEKIMEDDSSSSMEDTITEAMKTSALLARLADSAMDFGNDVDSADYATKSYRVASEDTSNQTVTMISEDTTEDRSMNAIINDLRSWIAETESSKKNP